MTDQTAGAQSILSVGRTTEESPQAPGRDVDDTVALHARPMTDQGESGTHPVLSGGRTAGEKPQVPTRGDVDATIALPTRPVAGQTEGGSRSVLSVENPPAPAAVVGGVTAVPVVSEDAASPSTNATIPASIDGELEGRAEARGTFGLLRFRTPPLRDGPGSPVRTTIPNKLRGRMDETQGNFTLVKLNLRKEPVLDERALEAKRSSELTQLQAKLALSTSRSYHGPKRLKPVKVPGTDPASLFLDVYGVDTSKLIAVKADHREQGLTATETKEEQARLLTLLRSLHPVTVVDQICKALAYFGGIPGAPAPADGIFPESLEANGPGSLFIGWIAEIFPRIDPEGGGSFVLQVTRKRGRGRPKGSKPKASLLKEAAKVDKAIPTERAAAAGDPSTSNRATHSQENSWVDVDESDDVGHPEPSPRASTFDVSRSLPIPSDSRPGLHATSSVGGAAPTMTSEGKRRGRPKGSKNRPKDPSETSIRAPRVGSSTDDQPPNTPTAIAGAIASEPRKSRPGRPKGSKNRPKDGDMENGDSSVPQTSSMRPFLPPGPRTPKVTKILPPKPLIDYNSASTGSQNSTTPVRGGAQTTANTSNPPTTGSKRKRSQQQQTDLTTLSSNSTATSTSNGAQLQAQQADARSASTISASVGPADHAAPLSPAAKRQRRSKEAVGQPAIAGNWVAAVVGPSSGAGQAPDTSVSASVSPPRSQQIDARVEDSGLPQTSPPRQNEARNGTPGRQRRQQQPQQQEEQQRPQQQQTSAVLKPQSSVRTPRRETVQGSVRLQQGPGPSQNTYSQTRIPVPQYAHQQYSSSQPHGLSNNGSGSNIPHASAFVGQAAPPIPNGNGNYLTRVRPSISGSQGVASTPPESGYGAAPNQGLGRSRPQRYSAQQQAPHHNVQSYHSFPTETTMFDIGSLDSGVGAGSVGLNTGTYSLSTDGIQRASANNGNFGLWRLQEEDD